MFKRTQVFAIFIGLLAFVFAVSGLNQQEIPETKTLRVSASGESFTIPTQANITIRTSNRDLKPEEVSEIIDDTLDVLNSDPLRSFTVFQTAQNGYGSIEGQHSIDQSFEIAVDDITKVSDVIDSLVTALPINYYNVYFAPSESQELEQQAIADAIQNSRIQAEYLAAQTGNTLGDIVSLDITTPSHFISTNNISSNYPGEIASIDSDSVLASPSITRVSISVTYELK